MNKVVIISMILLGMLFVIIFLYLISRHKQQSIRVFTLESFINAHHLNEIEDQKKSLIDTLNNFFGDDDNDGTIDGLDNGDSDDGGDDSGE